MRVRAYYVRDLEAPASRQMSVPAALTAALFSMGNPQTNIVLKGCATLLGVAALGLALEAAVKALVNAYLRLRLSCFCFEIQFY